MADSPAHDPNAPTETRSGAPPGGAIPARGLPRIPGFRIVRQIGQGGMGEVYEAVAEPLNVTYALKTIRPDRVGPRFLVRFRREARTMTHLEHPNIARFYHYGETAEGPYFTMKYFPDGTLAERMGLYRGEDRLSAGLMGKVARALHYLHTKGFVHRDLKPQNILFDGDEPFVSDFGLAKEQGDADEGPGYSPAPGVPETDRALAQAETRTYERGDPAGLATVTGGIVGTLPYMSPEQVCGRGHEITAKADLWALGVLLYELLTGRRPFEADDQEAVSELIKRAEPPTPGVGGRPIDPGLCRIIKRCLAKDPGQRYESAARLADDLDAWLHPRPTPRTWPRVVVSGVVAALFIVATVVLYRGRNADDGPPPSKADTALISTVPDEQIADQLRRGDVAEVLGPLGKPAFLRWRSGEGDARVTLWYTDKALTVTSDSVAILEAMSKVPAARYLFEVEVRVNDAEACAGVYVGHQTFTTPAGEGHFFVGFSFSEQRTAEDFSRHDVRYWAHVRRPDDRPLTAPVEVLNLVDHFHNTGARKDPPWRRLAVKVTPDALEFRWDGEPFRTVPRTTPPHRLEQLSRNAQAPAPLPINFRAHDAFGLFVYGGSASFQNARITTLTE